MRYMLTIVMVGSLMSCVSSGKKVNQEEVTQFKKGETTYTEVVSKLGEPTQSTVNSDGSRRIMYTYYQMQQSALNFVPLVGGLFGGGESESSNVIMTFNEDSILTNYSASQGGQSTGAGVISGQKQ